MWRKFFKRFGAIVVATEDFDGEVRYRFAKISPVSGTLRCRGVCMYWAVLNDDGTCSGSARYVARWTYV